MFVFCALTNEHPALMQLLVPWELMLTNTPPQSNSSPSSSPPQPPCSNCSCTATCPPLDVWQWITFLRLYLPRENHGKFSKKITRYILYLGNFFHTFVHSKCNQNNHSTQMPRQRKSSHITCKDVYVVLHLGGLAVHFCL